MTDSVRGLVFRIRANALTERRWTIDELRPFVRLSDTEVGSYRTGLLPRGGATCSSSARPAACWRAWISRRSARSPGRPRRRRDSGRMTASRAAGTLYAVNSAARVSETGLAATGVAASSGATSRARASTPRRLRGDRFYARLLAVNSQFDKRGGSPLLPFSVSALSRPRESFLLLRQARDLASAAAAARSAGCW